MSQVSKTLFGQLGTLPADPILGLSTAFAAETNPNKIDLGVGIYRDEAGRTPVMVVVLEAEERLLRSEGSKAYMVPAGDDAFNSGIRDLLLGKDHAVLPQARVNSIQTPGGCGALRIGSG
jgi:aspartate aminotransferase